LNNIHKLIYVTIYVLLTIIKNIVLFLLSFLIKISYTVKTMNLIREIYELALIKKMKIEGR